MVVPCIIKEKNEINGTVIKYKILLKISFLFDLITVIEKIKGIINPENSYLETILAP